MYPLGPPRHRKRRVGSIGRQTCSGRRHPGLVCDNPPTRQPHRGVFAGRGRFFDRAQEALMDALNERSAGGMGSGRIPRRHFLTSVLAVGLWRPRAAGAQQSPQRQDSLLPIRVSTLNHVSFGCADLKSTVEWYGRVFGMAVHAFQDYAGVRRSSESGTDRLIWRCRGGTRTAMASRRPAARTSAGESKTSMSTASSGLFRKCRRRPRRFCERARPSTASISTTPTACPFNSIRRTRAAAAGSSVTCATVPPRRRGRRALRRQFRSGR